MLGKYLNKRDEKLIEEIKRDRKFSKKALLWGVYGLSLMAIDLFSNKYGVESLSKSITSMNFNELMHTVIFGASTLATFGGGAIYTASYIMEPEIKDIKTKDKTNNLENSLKD